MLHNPYDGITPSQRQAAVAHRERLFRLSGHAVKLRDAVPPTVDDITADILEDRWANRQKDGWFSIVEETSPWRPQISSIQHATATHFGITRAELFSERRTMDVVVPRQIAMYLAKKLTTRSLPEIGRRFGGRDHTTILHAVRKIGSLIKTDWLTAYDVAHVEALL